MGVLQFQIGSLRCQVRPHREENINVDSVREGALSGDGLFRIDTTAGMLTALSEKQQEDENGRRREGGRTVESGISGPNHTTQNEWCHCRGLRRMQTALGSVLRGLEMWKSAAGKLGGEMR